MQNGGKLFFIDITMMMVAAAPKVQGEKETARM